MDFSYTEEQRAIFDLAQQILKEGTPPSRLLEIERAEGPRFDLDLWTKLGGAGLCGLAVPEAFGGGGFGFVELAGVLEQIGRTTAPVPFFETTVLGGLALAEFGNDIQKQTILCEVASGQRILTAALVEVEASSLSPKTRAKRVGDGWQIDGAKAYVPAAEIADQILVPATTDEGLAVFIVDRQAPGVTLDALATTSQMPESMLRLESVSLPGDALLGDVGQGGEIIEFIELRANAALCSLALGVCEAALELTAEYLKTRKQFDQPIAMFQAVSHREADAYIDTQSLRLTALEVAWLISVGRDARAEVAIARYVASEASYRVTFSAQHIHGGIGVDREYPVHRYYLSLRATSRVDPRRVDPSSSAPGQAHCRGCGLKSARDGSGVSFEEISNQPLGNADVARKRGRHGIRGKPVGRFDLFAVDRDLTRLVFRAKPEHQRVRKGPGLAREIFDILDDDRGFLEDLANDGFLGALARFDEPGQHAHDARRKMGRSREQDLVAFFDRNDHRRRESGIGGNLALGTTA